MKFARLPDPPTLAIMRYANPGGKIMLTPDMIKTCILYSRDLPEYRIRELIERAHQFGSGSHSATPEKIMEVLQQTACLCQALLDNREPSR